MSKKKSEKKIPVRESNESYSYLKIVVELLQKIMPMIWKYEESEPE